MMGASNRVIECTIAGKTYCMNYSVLAVKLLSEKAGGRDRLDAWLAADEEPPYPNTLYAAEVLISAGASYMRAFDGSDYPVATADELMSLCSEGDISYLSECTALAIMRGRVREIEAEPPKKEDGARIR